MPCTFKSHDCDGSYTDSACAKCQDLEGEFCNRNKLSTTCKGPFADKPCGLCKNLVPGGMQPAERRAFFEEFKLGRVASKKWRVGLQLDTVQLNKIYLGSSKFTPAQIDQKYQDAGGLDWCPWVQIGNLYALVTTGNNVGWRMLVTDLFEAKKGTHFSVFTGRHGVTQGTLTKDEDDDLFWDGVPDENHLVQDLVQNQVLRAKFAATPQDRPHVYIYDVGTTAGATMSKTQQLASERLAKGHVVIFAWCWSLLSVYKASSKSAQARYPLHEAQQPYNMSIADIVTDKYGWVVAAGAKPDGYDDWRKLLSARRVRAKQGMQGALGSTKSTKPNVAEDSNYIAELERKMSEHFINK